MSVNPTLIDAELSDYIRNNFSGEDKFLAELREEAETAGLPAISIAPEQISFLQAMISSLNAKLIIEFGTLGGYSAIAMARAMSPDAKLISIELLKKHYDFAKQKVIESGLSNIIELRNEKGTDFLDNYKFATEIDLVFADADKSSYITYLNRTLPHIRQGGMFIADNAFAFGNISKDVPDRNPESVKAIKEFNQYLIDNIAFKTCIIPLGDGMILGVKL